MNVYKKTLDKMNVYEKTLDKITLHEITLDKMTVHGMTLDKMTLQNGIGWNDCSQNAIYKMALDEMTSCRGQTQNQNF